MKTLEARGEAEIRSGARGGAGPDAGLDAGPGVEASHYEGPIRWMVLSAGVVLTGIGVIGIFLPVLPTTCFLLLAGWCFARSSRALHHWLHGNPWFGDHLRRYAESGTVTPWVKWSSVAFLWGGITGSVALFVSNGPVRLALAAVAVAVTVHLVRLPTGCAEPTGDPR